MHCRGADTALRPEPVRPPARPSSPPPAPSQRTKPIQPLRPSSLPSSFSSHPSRTCQPCILAASHSPQAHLTLANWRRPPSPQTVARHALVRRPPRRPAPVAPDAHDAQAGACAGLHERCQEPRAREPGQVPGPERHPRLPPRSGQDVLPCVPSSSSSSLSLARRLSTLLVTGWRNGCCSRAQLWRLLALPEPFVFAYGPSGRRQLVEGRDGWLPPLSTEPLTGSSFSSFPCAPLPSLPLSPCRAIESSPSGLLSTPRPRRLPLPARSASSSLYDASCRSVSAPMPRGHLTSGSHSFPLATIGISPSQKRAPLSPVSNRRPPRPLADRRRRPGPPRRHVLRFRLADVAAHRRAYFLPVAPRLASTVSRDQTSRLWRTSSNARLPPRGPSLTHQPRSSRPLGQGVKNRRRHRATSVFAGLQGLD